MLSDPFASSEKRDEKVHNAKNGRAATEEEAEASLTPPGVHGSGGRARGVTVSGGAPEGTSVGGGSSVAPTTSHSSHSLSLSHSLVFVFFFFVDRSGRHHCGFLLAHHQHSPPCSFVRVNQQGADEGMGVAAAAGETSSGTHHTGYTRVALKKMKRQSHTDSNGHRSHKRHTCKTKKFRD